MDYSVLVIGGRDYITPKRRQGLYPVYKRDFFPANWVIMYYQSHLVPEPKYSIKLCIISSMNPKIWLMIGSAGGRYITNPNNTPEPE